MKQVAGDTIDVSALEAYSDKGVANAQELMRQFQDVAYRIINAGEGQKDASVMCMSVRRVCPAGRHWNSVAAAWSAA